MCVVAMSYLFVYIYIYIYIFYERGISIAVPRSRRGRENDEESGKGGGEVGLLEMWLLGRAFVEEQVEEDEDWELREEERVDGCGGVEMR